MKQKMTRIVASRGKALCLRMAGGIVAFTFNAAGVSSK
jgi:hypothetical protein